MSAVSSLPTLSRTFVEAGVTAEPPFESAVQLPAPALLSLPERAVQFGTGAFLRGFVDYFVDAANREGQFNGRIVAIGSTGSGRDRAFADQDGLYTLVTRGIEAGVAVDDRRVVASVSRALSASTDWHEVLQCARNPQLSVVFSNTTEVGITLDEEDASGDVPPRSFPGKLTRFLYERARAFAFAPSKGVVVVPCELIEQNGEALREIVLALADRWGYGPGFARWIESAVPFCNTLVDRIVPGMPRTEEGDVLAAEHGYHDALMTCAEPYRLFVIEADDAVRVRLEFAHADTGIVVCDDATPYRVRKVSLLNGAHTIMVTAALQAGCETVRDAMQHPLVGAFLRQVLLDDILPVVDAPDAREFALAVLDRFDNPHIRHALIDITLHGTTKLRVRNVPTMIRATERAGRVPEAMALGFAAHLAWFASDQRSARVATGLSVPADEAGARIAERWTRVARHDAAQVRSLVRDIASESTLWGVDLSVLPQFVDTVAAHCHTILTAGMERALESVVVQHSVVGVA
ncbi:MAG TPA: tagaturonate reductase [Gemmatimonas sp.]|uniref:tagaturonate reductase n=1 Tax=Gemmatimonas sp. TaxID=1962908 RepID=UPI002ED99D1A